MNTTLGYALEKLVGRALSSVEFVADYVQLRFDGPTLTAYTLPSVMWRTESLGWGDPGYRDALCEQISHRVERTSVNKEQVSIAFEGGPLILVSLRDEDYRGPEALQFSLDEDRIWVA